jgi:FkbM family methyltransferase
MVCHPDWSDSVNACLDAAGDHFEMRLLSDWIQPNESCFDIGANVGLYTFCFAEKVGAGGEVISVDADIFITNRMQEAIRVLGADQVRQVHAAVCDKKGSLEFFVSAGQANTFEQSLVCPEGLSSSYKAVTVPAFTITDLESLLRNPSTLSVIKLDIEGAEAAALRVAGINLLNANGPLWQVEIHPEALRRFGASPRDVAEIFPVQEFDRWLLPKHPYHNVPGETRPRQLSSGESFDRSMYYNLMCVPRGQRWASRRRRLIAGLGGHDKE